MILSSFCSTNTALGICSKQFEGTHDSSFSMVDFVNEFQCHVPWFESDMDNLLNPSNDPT